MHGWRDIQRERLDRHLAGWLDGWLAGWMDGWMNGWIYTDRQIDRYI